MVLHLTRTICDKAKPAARRCDMRDDAVRVLFMRVETSGRKTRYLCYRTHAPERRLRNKKPACASCASLAAAGFIRRRFS